MFEARSLRSGNLFQNGTTSPERQHQPKGAPQCGVTSVLLNETTPQTLFIQRMDF